ncbi:hypothetical protein Cflav_PD5240 [Pedosphaera parvula Ellin514]|uniref:Uncharacterized protein n=1 Tax=Pedosphaera parvula (strain Ellin514) TaxID=320771 RepID=B9XCD7_PEDPL|nr:hypothetical protein Cflav_PD5240 [Pedosphaera parvula Ellin514]
MVAHGLLMAAFGSAFVVMMNKNFCSAAENLQMWLLRVEEEMVAIYCMVR